MAFRFNISKKIAAGYFVILFIISITSIVSILELEANKTEYNEISNVYLTVSYLREFDALSKEANRLIVNWVHLANKDEKDRLRLIQSQEYPALKTKIQNFAETSINADLQKKIAGVLKDFDNTVIFQKQIMKKLETPENYSNDTAVDASLNILDNQITPRFAEGQNQLNLVIAGETTALDRLEKQLDRSYNYLASIMILILAIIIIVGTVASLLATQSISMPIVGLKNIITSLGKGDIPEVTLVEREDEIGEITEAIHAMIKSIQLKTEFAIQTGSGNYSADFILGEKDILGNALLVMRDNLKHTAEEDAGRNWINAGLAQAGELLRIDRERGHTFYSDIIKFLSEYLNARLGVLFTFNDHDKNDIHLELTASYALDKADQARNKITLGQGLAGQAAVEKKIILIRDVPKDYVKIKSGLGETQPKNIIIAPLVFENELKGLIELASIEDFTDLHIEFLEKITKNIAITFDLAGRKARTEMLLVESRKLNEQLKLSQGKLTTANEELSTFVYKASHDLRGPLSTMMGLINLALEEPDNIEVEIVQAISETANKLDGILHVLIRTMTIRDAALKKEEIDFKVRIQDVIQELKNEKNMSRMRVITNVENRQKFKSDSEILGYILHNILENTIKFQNFSMPDSFAIIDVQDHENGVKINISDNGIGINSNLKNKVFEMFFRGNASASGSGLGLYFVKNAINKLEGQIEFVSQEGVGTVFSIFLPSLS